MNEEYANSNMNPMKQQQQQQHQPTNFVRPGSPTSASSPLLYYGLQNKLASNGKEFIMNNKNLNSSSNIEMIMLELILNELEASIENKESYERLRQMIVQMHLYFNEKINDQIASKNKLLAEFDEHKMGLQAENEQLRCQLKLLQIQNEFSKDNYVKKNLLPTSIVQQNKLPTPSSTPNANNNNNNNSQSSSSSSSTHSSQLNKNTSPNNLIATSQQIQLLLQQQQQQQQHHLHKTHDLQAAAVAAQSFPQLFLNHYTPNVNCRTSAQFLEQLTSTPKKTLNLNEQSMFTLSTPSSASNSSSSPSPFANPKLNTSPSKQFQQANGLILSIPTKLENNYISKLEPNSTSSTA